MDGPFEVAVFQELSVVAIAAKFEYYGAWLLIDKALSRREGEQVHISVSGTEPEMRLLASCLNFIYWRSERLYWTDHLK